MSPGRHFRPIVHFANCAFGRGLPWLSILFYQSIMRFIVVYCGLVWSSEAIYRVIHPDHNPNHVNTTTRILIPKNDIVACVGCTKSFSLLKSPKTTIIPSCKKVLVSWLWDLAVSNHFSSHVWRGILATTGISVMWRVPRCRLVLRPTWSLSQTFQDISINQQVFAT